ncbi:hypothetical protein U0070_000928, partial [Myodes glareolus]
LAPESPSRVDRTPRRRPTVPVPGDPRHPELPGRAPAPPSPRPRPAPRSPEKLSKAEMDLELEGVRESVAKKFEERSMCDKVVSATVKIRADQSAIPSNQDCGPEVLRLRLLHLSQDSLSPTNPSSR